MSSKKPNQPINIRDKAVKVWEKNLDALAEKLVERGKNLDEWEKEQNIRQMRLTERKDELNQIEAKRKAEIDLLVGELKQKEDILRQHELTLNEKLKAVKQDLETYDIKESKICDMREEQEQKIGSFKREIEALTIELDAKRTRLMEQAHQLDLLEKEIKDKEEKLKQAQIAVQAPTATSPA